MLVVRGIARVPLVATVNPNFTLEDYMGPDFSDSRNSIFSHSRVPIFSRSRTGIPNLFTISSHLGTRIVNAYHFFQNNQFDRILVFFRRMICIKITIKDHN